MQTYNLTHRKNVYPICNDGHYHTFSPWPFWFLHGTKMKEQSQYPLSKSWISHINQWQVFECVSSLSPFKKRVYALFTIYKSE